MGRNRAWRSGRLPASATRRCAIPLVAGAALVVSCSAGDGGASASTASSAEAGQATNSTATSPMPGSAPPPSGPVQPIVLDAQTVAWFDSLCGGLTQAIQALDPNGTGLTDPSLAPPEVVAAVRSAGTLFGDTAADLETLPPPTFQGGAALAATVAAGLGAAATSFPQSAATFESIDSSDVDALTAARGTLQVELLTVLAAPLQSIEDLPQDLRSTIKVIPACRSLTT